MDERVERAIEDSARASHEGTRSFAAIVAALLQVGVESYHADYRAQRTTYYLPNGQQHGVSLPVPTLDIPEQLATAQLQEAIRGSQRGEVKYPEFLRRSTAAGCAGYHVFITGRHVLYYGRSGNQHIEHFPS